MSNAKKTAAEIDRLDKLAVDTLLDLAGRLADAKSLLKRLLAAHEAPRRTSASQWLALWDEVRTLLAPRTAGQVKQLRQKVKLAPKPLRRHRLGGGS